MKRSQVFVLSLLSAFALIVLHIFSVSMRLYWSIWWLDIVFHFWGGIIVGSVVVSLFISRSDTIFYAARIVTLSTLAVAIAWELHEFIAQTFYAQNYLLDTVADILLGVAGGLTALLVAHRALNNPKKKKS